MTVEKKPDNRLKGPTKKKQSSWEPVKVIIHKDTRIAARVSRLFLRPHPKYTYEIGTVDEADRFKRFLHPTVKIDNGEVTVEAINEVGVRWSMEQAEMFIVEEVQKREDELQLQAKSRAPRKMNEPKRPDA